jgi:hypothetical protein
VLESIRAGLLASIFVVTSAGGATTNTEASSYGNNESFAVRKQHSSYAVVKYFSDEPGEATTPSQ